MPTLAGPQGQVPSASNQDLGSLGNIMKAVQGVSDKGTCG